jgi:hypothetical protein
MKTQSAAPHLDWNMAVRFRREYQFAYDRFEPPEQTAVYPQFCLAGSSAASQRPPEMGN